MKTSFVTLCIIALGVLVGVSNSFAQKLGYLNSQQILANFKEALDTQQKLDLINQGWEKEARDMQAQFQEMGQQLESQSLLLSEERKQAKQQELQTLYTKIQQFQAEKWGQNGEFFKKQDEMMKPVIEKVNTAIKKVGEEERFDYIFDTVSANIVWASPSQQDVTELVVKELEKGLQTTKK